MAKKHVKSSPEVAPAASATAAKPAIKPTAKSAPRVSNSRHSHSKGDAISATAATLVSPGHVPVPAVEQTKSEPPTVDAPVLETPVAEMAIPESQEKQFDDPRLLIEKIAYGYFEARGYQHGNPLEDWVRAEQEYHRTRS